MFAGNDADYNCFVMGAQLWADYGVKHQCDFLTMRPDVVRAQILDYSESGDHFLDHQSKENEVFAVIDNSGWYTAITHPEMTKEPAAKKGVEDLNAPDGDVYFQLDVKSYYKDNDIYNNVYHGFLVVMSIIVLVLISFLIALKCIRMKYNKLMEEKAEFKQQLYLRQQSTLKNDITALRNKSNGSAFA